MWAAFQGDETLLKLLLERGAKVNDLVETGGALGQAAWGGHAGVARLLLDAGAQVDQRDLVANYTPLHWAASSERSSPAVVELLLARGADAQCRRRPDRGQLSGRGANAVVLARKRGDTPIVQALLKAGAKDLPVRSAAAEDPQQASRSRREDRGRGHSAGAAAADEDRPRIPSPHFFGMRASKTASPVTSNSSRWRRSAWRIPAISRPIAEATRHQIELLKRSFFTGHIQNRTHLQEVNLQTTFHPEPAILAGYAALSFQLEHEPASA